MPPDARRSQSDHRVCRRFYTSDAAATRSLGKCLGHQAIAGDFIACNGPIGAGKTTLVQGFAEGLGVGSEAYVRSPTFTLMHEYHGRIPLYHFDFYRLSDYSEVYEIGFDEYCDAGGVVIVEWAEKFPTVLPGSRLEVTMQAFHTHGRVIQWHIVDPSYKRYEHCFSEDAARR